MKIQLSAKDVGAWSPRGEFCRLAKRIWASHGFPGVVYRCQERLVRKANGYEVQVRVKHMPQAQAQKKFISAMKKMMKKGKK